MRSLGMVLSLLLCAALLPANAQDPLQTLPQNYWKVFENADITVIRAHYGAHEKIPVHDHAGFATVFVYLNDSSPVRIVHTEDAKTDSTIRPPTVAGAFRVIPGMAETHSIENLGDKPSDFLRIEFKHLTLSTPKEGFRGKAPASLATDQDTVEFSDPSGLQIERIVCVGAGPCAVKPSDSASLLVLLSEATLHEQHLAVGQVRWLNASESLSLTPQAGAAIHLLRILIPLQPQRSSEPMMQTHEALCLRMVQASPAQPAPAAYRVELSLPAFFAQCRRWS